MTIHFGHFPGDDSARTAIPLYGKGEFESPTRSTIPLLSLLIHAPSIYRDLISDLGMSSGYHECLEYQVRSRRGRGKASHTDLMLRRLDVALAIEAKWTEPIGPTVADWLATGKQSQNYQDVLKGWLEWLEPRSSRSLKPADFHGVRYQMLHRAASAAATGHWPRMAYFLFRLNSGPKTTSGDEIIRELGVLWGLLGQPKEFPFSLVEIEMKPLEPYDRLRGLPRKSPDTAQAVIAALNHSEPLFEFRPAKPRTVTKADV